MTFGSWKWRWFCACGESFAKGHMYDICPKCAAHKATFFACISRWVDTSVWWNPWSAEQGFWEKKEPSVGAYAANFADVTNMR
jgi:hypothetical protein